MDTALIGQIEKALEEHAAVSQAAVCTQAIDGEFQLIAYVVTTGDRPTVAQLRSYLLERLPKHPSPSVFVTLDAIPLTASGAPDYGVLPPANPIWLAIEEPYVAPSTPLEIRLVEIFKEVLMVDKVGIHDDFLTLGGDSLLAGQVVARISAQFDIQLPLELMFEHGSVSQIINDFFPQP